MDGTKLYQNREDAGYQLAIQLEKYKKGPNAIVLALPRAGVPVAYQVAKHMSLPLDVFVVRKLGVPFQPELAMGAIASGGIHYFNKDILSQLNLSEDQINHVVEQEMIELKRREAKYCEGREFPDISDKIVILVDDGIATGASIIAAIMALKKNLPKKIILAVPVTPQDTVKKIASLVYKFVCLYPAPFFYGVGQFYEDFSQTQDSEVQFFLQQSKENK